MSPYVKTLRAAMPWPVTEHALTETERDEAAKQDVGYRCPKGHADTITFAADVAPPDAWDCRRCGGVALRAGAPGDAPALPEFPGYAGPGHGAGSAKSGKTPWVHVLERRSISDLERALAERMAQIRESGVTR